MPWCPVCKCEYKKGIEKCADCKVDLVESLEAENPEEKEEAIEFANAMVFTEALEEASIEAGDKEEDGDTEAEKEADAELVKFNIPKKVNVYQDSREKSSENRNSAYILLGVGIIGSVILILICLDIIPVYTSLTSKIITAGVMGSLFVLFIVMGIVSLKNAKKFDKQAALEGDLTKGILDYCEEKCSKDAIDEALNDEEWEELSEELKYFKRIEYIKAVITRQFMNLEEEYLDHICDRVYEMFYEG